MGNSQSDSGSGREGHAEAEVLCVTLSLHVDDDLPAGWSPCVLGEGRLLGNWEPARAVKLRREGHFWRLHFFSPSGNVSFQYGLVSAEGTVLLEVGGRRSVAGDGREESGETDGGALVRLPLPPSPDATAAASEQVLRGFCSWSASREDVLALAGSCWESRQRGGRAGEYWAQADAPRPSDGLPSLHVSTSVHRRSEGNVSLNSVGSFHDLVLVSNGRHAPSSPPSASPPAASLPPDESEHGEDANAEAERCDTPDATAALIAAAASNETLLRTPTRLGHPGRVVPASPAPSPPVGISPSPPSAAVTERRRLVIAMVGLPARGKSFTAHKLHRYLSWLGHPTKHFNVGQYRREFTGGHTPEGYFSPENSDAVAGRTALAKLAFSDMLEWMEKDGGQVGIFDATNSTRERRALIQELCRGKCRLIFVEVLCTDEEQLRRNVLDKVRASPDYEGMPPAVATADFLKRVDDYAKSYEPLRPGDGDGNSHETFSFIRAANLASGGGSLHAERIQGYLPGRLVSFLLNQRLSTRPIFLCRHGQSQDNLGGRIGGDSALSPAGTLFATSLGVFLSQLPGEQRPHAVWTSTLRRTIQTASALPQAKVTWSALDEIDAGSCDGLTYAQMESCLSEEFAARQADKLRYRYPRGESYLDLIARLEPVILEVERQTSPVLIVAHQAILRCLLGYFLAKPVEEVPYIEMPLHTVISLTPSGGGVREEHHSLHPGPVA